MHLAVLVPSYTDTLHHTYLRQYNVGILKCLLDLQHPIWGPANVVPWYERIFNAQYRWPVTLRHVPLHLEWDTTNVKPPDWEFYNDLPIPPTPWSLEVADVDVSIPPCSGTSSRQTQSCYFQLSHLTYPLSLTHSPSAPPLYSLLTTSFSPIPFLTFILDFHPLSFHFSCSFPSQCTVLHPLHSSDSHTHYKLLIHTISAFSTGKSYQRETTKGKWTGKSYQRWTEK